MEKNFEQKYHLLEKTHFWFKARRNYILQLLKKQPKDISILDIGCSSGILLDELRESGFDANNLYGVDISERAIQNCNSIGIQYSFVMDAQYVELDKKFDIIIASDCLEHLKYDEKALQNWNKLLKKDGILYVFVPAFKMLWSSHDVLNMHYRRYTKNTLKNKLQSNHFTIIKSGYWNFFLFLPVLIIKLLNKEGKVANNEEMTSDLDNINIFNKLLFWIINFENKLLKYVSFPFGVSTFCIAKKEDNHSV